MRRLRHYQTFTQQLCWQVPCRPACSRTLLTSSALCHVTSSASAVHVLKYAQHVQSRRMMMGTTTITTVITTMTVTMTRGSDQHKGDYVECSRSAL